MASTRTVALWSFNEAEEVPPSDAIGNVVDLTPPTGLTAPERSSGLLGGARAWASGTGYAASLPVTTPLALTRSVAVEAVVRLEDEDGDRIIAQFGAGNFGDPWERCLYSLRVSRASSVWTLALGADDKDQVYFEASSTFSKVGEWFYLAAVRRWSAPTSHVVDLYVNGALIASVPQTEDLGVAALTDVPTFFIGAGYAAGFTSEMVAGDEIDEIRVTRGERTAEEIALQYDRMTWYASAGYDLLRALLPPGQAYSSSPESRVQREIMVEGTGLGYAWSYLDELRKDYLPDRATRLLDQWEAITRLKPGPLDSYATRRARVVGHLRAVHGYTCDNIVKAVADLLDLEEADVEIVEQTNRVTDAFPGVAVSDYWIEDPGAGTLAVAANVLTVAFQTGDAACWSHALSDPVRIRRSVLDPELMSVVVKISAVSLATNDDMVGVFFEDLVSGDVHILGVRRSGGSNVYASRLISGGATTDVNYSAFSGTPWLKFTRAEAGTWSIYSSTTSDEGPWTLVQAGIASVTEFEHTGVCAFTGNVISAPANGSIALSSWEMRCPRATCVYEWAIFRDPLLAGTPDIPGAQRVVDRMKPAHTRGHVVTSVEALCDDSESLCDRDVLGG